MIPPIRFLCWHAQQMFPNTDVTLPERTQVWMPVCVEMEHLFSAKRSEQIDLWKFTQHVDGQLSQQHCSLTVSLSSAAFHIELQRSPSVSVSG